ncbi:transporter [Jeotgalibacillus haloalkalitolerans]|uniref:Transporter n=1 Tax=Jeotgalibacillus haloalkalitolerans TaxID=3104292 RepID=A0ABU5KQN6_9BACL|nr:transporter [Jeotgalibacillus sp. HH7-29]MDZ5713462.1 transporter [Jeotgalibacillus sp. HH7-29]
MSSILSKIYEGFMIILVIFTITTLWSDQPYSSLTNWIVWLIFFIDFAIRLFRADSKWGFIKKHPFLTIAIIPFDQFFQAARIVRVIYLFRTKTITKHYVQPVIDKASNASKMILLISVIGLFFIESLIIWQMPNVITTYSEALTFIFSQLLFFGRRIYEIESTLMHTFVIINSIIGVILHGIALQWLFNRFDHTFASFKKYVKSKVSSS